MIRIISLLIGAGIFLSACEAGRTVVTSGGTGQAKIYRISRADASRVQFRMLDSVNALRRAAGTSDLKLNSRLNAAAATHSRDMSVQNRPWHFGSDGSSPIERVLRSGYPLTMLGENISESFETELETLAAWMELTDTRSVILDPEGRDLGFAWHQDPGGKIWWTLIIGGGGPAPLAPIPTPEPEPVEDVPQG